MGQVWFCSIRGIERGPLSTAELQELAAAGKLGPRDFVCCGSTRRSWMMAERVDGLTFGRRTDDAKNESVAATDNKTAVIEAALSETQTVPPSDPAETFRLRSARIMSLVGHELSSSMVRLGLEIRYGWQCVVVAVFQGLARLAEVWLGRQVAKQRESASELAGEAELRSRELKTSSFTERLRGCRSLLAIYRKLGIETLREDAGKDSSERRLAASLRQRAQENLEVRQSLAVQLATRDGFHPLVLVGYGAVALILFATVISVWTSEQANDDPHSANVVTSAGRGEPSTTVTSNQTIANQAVAARNPTVTYWQRVRSIIGSSRSGTHNPATARAALLSTARQLTQLSVIGVDEEPVQFVLKASRLFGDLAAAEEYYSSPDFLVDSFLQGANGQALEGFQQLQTVRQDVFRRMREANNQFTETEMVISRRYGIEFPPEDN